MQRENRGAIKWDDPLKIATYFGFWIHSFVCSESDLLSLAWRPSIPPHNSSSVSGRWRSQTSRYMENRLCFYHKWEIKHAEECEDYLKGADDHSAEARFHGCLWTCQVLSKYACVWSWTDGRCVENPCTPSWLVCSTCSHLNVSFLWLKSTSLWVHLCVFGVRRLLHLTTNISLFLATQHALHRRLALFWVPRRIARSAWKAHLIKWRDATSI